MKQPETQPTKAIEETSLNAWAALQQMVYDGWILRFADGYTRRANSVNPLYAGRLDVDRKIKRCEEVYRHRQFPTIFKITPFVHPSNLDDRLAQAGYQKDALTSVQTLNLNLVQNSGLETAEFSKTSAVYPAARQWETPAEEWIEQFARMNQVSPTKLSTLRSILNNIVPETIFMTLLHRGQTVSCGLGVLEGQYIGLFDIVTTPTQRNQGFGTKLILNMLNWAKQRGAQKAYLQVMLDNAPALRLYAKLGFMEIYKYWYRVKE